jgi:hypothetical protein
MAVTIMTAIIVAERVIKHLIRITPQSLRIAEKTKAERSIVDRYAIFMGLEKAICRINIDLKRLP